MRPVPSTARRSAASRAAMMLVALLSAVLLGGAQGMSCELHGLVGGVQAAATAGHAMVGHAMAGHAEMAGMAGMSHESGSTDAGDHGGCGCTCIGDCTMVAPLANAPFATTLLVALVAPEPVRALDAEPRRSPHVEPDRLLPFANGPPASALV